MSFIKGIVFGIVVGMSWIVVNGIVVSVSLGAMGGSNPSVEADVAGWEVQYLVSEDGHGCGSVDYILSVRETLVYPDQTAEVEVTKIYPYHIVSQSRGRVSRQARQSKAELEQLLRECETRGGALENVAVEAGHFVTCRFTSVTETGWDKTVWMGVVPFGVVQKLMVDRSTGRQELYQLRRFSAW
ncbi:MAG: hypothetical protein RMK80_09155 [Pseudobdellovibrionaceae bacterium]|nr:hypothetical protein [Pseudobdellovibrionaceae bacterium]